MNLFLFQNLRNIFVLEDMAGTQLMRFDEFQQHVLGAINTISLMEPEDRARALWTASLFLKDRAAEADLEADRL